MTESPNIQTLQSYERHRAEYIAGTNNVVEHGVKKWIDRFLLGLQNDVRIIEIGGAFGRDAAYVQGKGYKVECTDAVHGFVDHMAMEGFDARHFNVLTDELPCSCYDLVYANAVLLHFTFDETKAVFQKIYRALKPHGRFAFTVKRGQGSAWSDKKLGAPRFFQYWSKCDAEALLAKEGFSIQYVSEDGSGHDSSDWLSYVADKQG